MLLSDQTQIRPERSSDFIRRAERYDIELQLRFSSPGCLAWGHSLNLSTSGMLAVFSEPLEVWVTGELTIQHGETPVKLIARVARVDGCQAGLAFRIGGEDDRRSIHSLLQRAAAAGRSSQ